MAHKRPDNDLSLAKLVSGCANPGFRIHEAFATTGIRLVDPLALRPRVAVLGLAPQFTLLPSPSTFPCVLLPSPDVVVFMPYGIGVDIPIPAAARPIAIYAQAVMVAGIDDLRSSDGCHVSAF